MLRGRLRTVFLLSAVLYFPRLVSATEVPPPAPEATEGLPGEDEQESGILPPNAGTVTSTTTITPTTQFPEKPPYDQAKEELAQAQALQAKGALEAASDTALEAYEDLLQIRRPRGPKRNQVHQERQQAATIYIDAGIGFINEWIKNQGSTSEAVKEGIGRLEDLRDVARDYQELNHRLNRAIDQWSAKK